MGDLRNSAMCRWPNYGCADIPERCEVERRIQTPAEQLKQRIQQRRDREAAELAAEFARHTARRDGEARVILDLAKKTMEEKLETMYHHPDSVDDRVADRLVLMCQSEGFICNKKHPGDGYVGIEIGIP